MSIYYGLNLLRQNRELSHDEWNRMILERQKLIAPFFDEIAHIELSKAFSVTGPEGQEHPIGDDDFKTFLNRGRFNTEVPSNIRGIFSDKPPQQHMGQWLMISWGLALNCEWFLITIHYNVEKFCQITRRVELSGVPLNYISESQGNSPVDIWRLLGEAVIAWHARTAYGDEYETTKIASGISEGLANLMTAEHALYEEIGR